MTKPSLPLLVYDGDCAFCRLWIDRWKHLTGDQVEYAPYQRVASRLPEIPVERFQEAVQLVEPTGEIYSGAHAVFRLLARVPGLRWMLWAYAKVPGAAAAAEAFYRFVAARRSPLYTLTRLLWGAHFERPSYELTRWVFLRLLALTYGIAFFSLYTQIPGLIGSRGILPARDFLQAVAQAMGPERYWAFPTLAWISPSDGFLRFLGLGGTLLSLVALAGYLPALVFALLWVFYLSLLVVGQDFLSFQWDILLLETGFLAILFAPRRWPLSRTVLWLYRLLVFRLIFSSGAVKLASGDPAWRQLRALDYHYQTQPLPTPLAWYMQQLPHWFQAFSTLFMFFVELVTPFFILAPRRLRSLAAGLMIFLQVLILLTGNYTFFNLLTISLCLLLFDDAALRRFLPPALAARIAAGSRRSGRPRVQRVLVTVLAALLIFGGLAEVGGVFQGLDALPAPAAQLVRRLSHLHIVSNYGLFAVMTTSRPEIVVEGSNDRQTWLEYEFKYKPGDVKRRPPVIEPFQPRLDWQMWFAALGDYRASPWFVNFMVRLLEGSPDVLALLQKNPFPGAPPRYIRAVRYDYHFTDYATRRAAGAWWRRTYTGLYFPVASLRGR